MGTWSQEFVNVSTGAGTNLLTWLQARSLEFARGSASTPGMILYFPPGDTILRMPARFYLVLAEPMEVMLAPGARIVLVGVGCALEIQGKLTAPVGPIFATRDTNPAGVFRHEVGTVWLTGSQLLHVHPEWWGGGSLAGRDPETDVAYDERNHIARVDVTAIEEAIRNAAFKPMPIAAPWNRPVRQGQTVVELLGSYILTRPVRVGHPSLFQTASDGGTNADSTIDPNMNVSVEIHGRLGDPRFSTLRSNDDFETLGTDQGNSLLDVRGVCSLRLHGVSFETTKNLVPCLQVDDPASPEQVATRRSHEFRHCRFRSSSVGPSTVQGSALVKMVVERTALSTLVPVGVLPSQLTPGVQFEGCVFEPAFPVGAAVQLRSESVLSTAEFRGCTFVGEALAMIDAQGFNVTTNGCRFENRLIPDKLRSGAHATRAAALAMHESHPEGGVDIYLGQQAPVVIRYALTGGGFGGGEPNYVNVSTKDPLAYPVGSLTAQDCRSTSPQFLVTCKPVPTNPSMRDATIIGLHHQFQHETFIDSEAKPPAIYWRASQSPVPLASLLLVGCRFDGLRSDGHPRILASQGGQQRPAVFNYGIVAGEQDIAMTAEIQTPGMIAPMTVLGVVPHAPNG